jgi:hypothetical protein
MVHACCRSWERLKEKALRCVIRWCLRGLAGSVTLLTLALCVYQFELRDRVPGQWGHAVSEDDFSSALWCAGARHVVVGVTLRAFNAQEGTVAAVVSACVPHALLLHLRVPTVSRLVPTTPVIAVTSAGQIESTPMLRRLAIPLQLFDGSEPRLSKALRLERFAYATELDDVIYHLGIIRVRATGSPEDFPFDAYRIDLQVQALETPGLVYQARPPSGAFSVGIPAQVAVVKDADMQSLRVAASGSAASVQVVVRRGRRTELFSLALLLVPMLLVGAFLYAVRALSRPPSPVELVVGIAAVLLAIMPIRTVLVPGSIADLTLVDYTLAFEVALLTLVSVWVVTR